MSDESPITSRLTPARDAPRASRADKAVIERQSRPSAVLIHETIRAEGESELKRGLVALVLSGTAAGLSIGLTLVAQGALRAKLPDAPWRDLVSYLGYTVGFLVVVLGRQQLFTENTLTPVLPLLARRNLATLGAVLRLWAAVLAANLVATWAVALAIAHGGAFDEEVRHAFAHVSAHAIGTDFGASFVKAVFAGWLIALMVWLLPAAESGRPFVIVAITYVVALGEFAHVVAGSVDAAYLVVTGAATLTDYAWRFFAPTLLGNVIGGVALVAVLNWGQVAEEIE